MTDVPISSFENLAWHAGASDIIRRRSSNHTDVRDAVLGGLDLSSVRDILDLGCGFGFMTEAFARRAAPDARIVGVDACVANERPYLEQVAATGRGGRFVCQRLDSKLDWPSGAFDLVVASYSLYFFPGVLPEVARVLAPHGMFLTVTHTEQSCHDLLRAAGLHERSSRLLGVIHSFSADNANRLLAPWFEQVERVDYQNTLTFKAAEYDDFLIYLRFKLPFLLPDSEPGPEPAGPLADALRASLSNQPRVVFEKSDAAFRCRCPRCP